MNDTQLLSPTETVMPATKTLDWLLTHMDVTASTLSDYSGRLAPFVRYLLDNGINDTTLLDYKRTLEADSTLGVATKNKKLTVARLFLRSLYQKGYLPRDISQGVKGFKQSKKHKVNGLDDDDMALLREWIGLNQSRSAKHLRLTCLLLLLTYNGLREIEVCRLQYEDIDFSSNRFFIRGKGRDDKEAVHISDDVASMLRRYCEAYQIRSGYVFTSISNNSSRGKPLSTRGLRASIVKLFNQLGIDKKVHGLRHFYVTKLIEEFPGDLFTVMNFSRHRSLDMLQVYNDALSSELHYPRHDMVFKKVLV